MKKDRRRGVPQVLYLRHATFSSMGATDVQETHDTSTMPLRDETAQSEYDRRECNAEDKFNCAFIVFCVVVCPLVYIFWMVNHLED